MSGMKTRMISATDTLALRQLVLRPGLPIEECRFSGDVDPQAGHFCVELDNQIIAVGSIYPEAPEGYHEGSDEAVEEMPGSAWRLRGMATNPDFRKRGAGALILKACLDHARSRGADLVWAHARVDAVAFYLKHGLEKVSDVYDIPGVGPHYLMGMTDF
jgi:GNAT superfamily N-acetyltransferase